MRGLLKNGELRRELIWMAGSAAVLAALAALWRPLAGLMVLAAGAVLLFLHLRFALRRCRAMSRLALAIDRVLHSQDGALITAQDEGELSILEDQIKKMTVRLRVANDLLRAEKGELSRAMEDIFHQIRTPLTALNIEAALLAEEDLPYDRRLRLTREARRQLQRLDWLVEALLKLSRIDAGVAEFRRETVTLRELVSKAAEPLALPMELRGQRLVLDVGEGAFTGDLDWSAEALGNLLKNCMEHAPAGGTVTVTGGETALYAQLTVRDDGPGFPAEDLPRLFERFYKGRDSGADSIGIGLALCRRIVAEQGGTVAADNPPEGGARFTVRFYKSVV